MTHTPGPWTPHGASVAKEGRNSEYTLATVTAHIPEEEGYATARLIAAAPDLLEALRALFQHCAMVHKHWGDNNNVQEADKAIAQAHAAIAKAAGE